MKLCGICITTNNAPRLAAFYTKVLQEQPNADGNHYGFDNAQLAVYDPGDVNVVKDKNMSIMFYVDEVQKEYERLLKEIPDINITSMPEHRPWGAFSFGFLDPDGNAVSFIEQKGI